MKHSGYETRCSIPCSILINYDHLVCLSRMNRLHRMSRFVLNQKTETLFYPCKQKTLLSILIPGHRHTKTCHNLHSNQVTISSHYNDITTSLESKRSSVPQDFTTHGVGINNVFDFIGNYWPWNINNKIYCLLDREDCLYSIGKLSQRMLSGVRVLYAPIVEQVRIYDMKQTIAKISEETNIFTPTTFQSSQRH